MKKELLIVTALVLLAAGILYALNLTSGKPNASKNGFSRNLSNITIREISRIDLNVRLHQLVGTNGDSLYFSSQIPGKIYRVNQHQKTIDIINFDIHDIPQLRTHFPTFVEYPDVYIIGGNSRKYIHGNILSGKYTVDTFLSKGAILNVSKVSKQNYIFRRITEIDRNAGFVKLNTNNNQLNVENNISPALADAGFTYDGMLNYDQTTGLLVHVPYYHNNVTVFDTNLNLIARHHSIDTHFVARNQTLTSGTSVTFKEPPVTVNSRSWLFNGHLYIVSKQKADNETEEDFNKYFPIDEYEILTGKYMQTYQLPKVPGQRMININMISSGKLIAIYSKAIIVYEIPL